MKCHKRLLHLPVVIALIVIVANIAQAATQSFNVEAGKDVEEIIELQASDTLSMSLQVTAVESSKLHFYIILPNSTIIDYGDTNQLTIELSTKVDGECKLHFDNSHSESAKLITINYNIEHYIFGVPQMLFLLIAIGILLLFVVAGYIAMGKYG